LGVQHSEKYGSSRAPWHLSRDFHVTHSSEGNRRFSSCVCDRQYLDFLDSEAMYGSSRYRKVFLTSTTY
jgi:hypothetical protein